MRFNTLKLKLVRSYIAVIVLFAICFALLGLYIIKGEIIDRQQNQVKKNLETGISIYNAELQSIKNSLNLAYSATNITGLRKKIGLDYLYVVRAKNQSKVNSEIALRAFTGNDVSGARVISLEELRAMGSNYVDKAQMAIVPTAKSRKKEETELHKALAMEYAMPVFDRKGDVIKVIYGGKIINRNFIFVDMIRDHVFESKLYKGKPVGTVTLFLDDVRVATNVLNSTGGRAIGTTVGDSVYQSVINNGNMWIDRAFVVTDWYLTAYAPIKDINGYRIGMIYVGELEEPFDDLKKNLLLMFIVIVGIAVLIASIFSIIMANTITKPLTGTLKAMKKFANGDMEHRMEPVEHLVELDSLADTFNEMADKLKEEDKMLRESNEELAKLNNNYLEMVGFVTHELKGVLASTTLNTYSLCNGLLGDISEKQKNALDSISRNLDYLAIMSKKFLNLSRIEVSGVTVHMSPVNLKDDIIDQSIKGFEQKIEQKNIRLEIDTMPNIEVDVDTDMFIVSVNNLIGNAIKYGVEGGLIQVSTKFVKDNVEVHVYNDGPPIDSEETEKLFDKFYRIKRSDNKVRGTGLGLFITSEIVKKHNGSICVEPKEKGNLFIIKIPGRLV